MLNKRIIKICLGSSCFSRGNKDLIKAVKKFVEKNNLSDKVAFSGDHCFNGCINGPNIRISGKLFQNVNQENINEILSKELSDLI